MNRVYIANFGEGNALWPTARDNSTILTINNVEVHDYWRAGDRDGFIETALQQTLTARGLRPTRQTAGRWPLVQRHHRNSGYGRRSLDHAAGTGPLVDHLAAG